MTKKTVEISFLWLIAVFAFSVRMLPHVPNLTPVGAIFFLYGLNVKEKMLLFIPLSIMFVSDMFIGIYNYKIMGTVYLSFILMYLVGLLIKNNSKLATVMGGALAGSFLFFLITNFAVWYFGAWYPKNLSGLLACYIAALPFFRNSLVGDIFYSSMFYLAYKAVSNESFIGKIIFNINKNKSHGYKASNQTN